MLYSNIEGILRWSGGTVLLSRGQSIDEDHPLAKERPDLFSTDAPGAELKSRPQPGKVQTAMTEPGGSRVTRTPKNTGTVL